MRESGRDGAFGLPSIRRENAVRTPRVCHRFAVRSPRRSERFPARTGAIRRREMIDSPSVNAQSPSRGDAAGHAPLWRIRKCPKKIERSSTAKIRSKKENKSMGTTKKRTEERAREEAEGPLRGPSAARGAIFQAEVKPRRNFLSFLDKKEHSSNDITPLLTRPMQNESEK